jgi:hypothetical protein
MMKEGTMSRHEEQRDRVCAIDGCDRLTDGSNLCRMHVREAEERWEALCARSRAERAARGDDAGEFKMVLCPRCRTNYFTPLGSPTRPGVLGPALSRTDRGDYGHKSLEERTFVCSDCGTEEALEVFAAITELGDSGAFN